MTRRLLNLLTLLSMLLCVAAGGLWVRSHSVGYWLTWRPLDWEDRPGEGMIWTGRGYVGVGSIGYRPGVRFVRTQPASVWSWGRVEEPDGPAALGAEGSHWGGFGLCGRQPATHIHEWRWLAWFPLWLPAVLFALLPISAATRWFRSRRRRSDLCPRCDYDLRATPHRCPECGHTPAGPIG